MTPFLKKAACVLDIIFFRDPNFPDKLNIPPPPSDLNIKVCRPMCTARIIGWGRSRTIYPGKEMEFIQSTRLFVFLLPRIPEHQKKFVSLFSVSLEGHGNIEAFFPHSLLSYKS